MASPGPKNKRHHPTCYGPTGLSSVYHDLWFGFLRGIRYGPRPTGRSTTWRAVVGGVVSRGHACLSQRGCGAAIRALGQQPSSEPRGPGGQAPSSSSSPRAGAARKTRAWGTQEVSQSAARVERMSQAAAPDQRGRLERRPPCPCPPRTTETVGQSVSRTAGQSVNQSVSPSIRGNPFPRLLVDVTVGMVTHTQWWLHFSINATH